MKFIKLILLLSLISSLNSCGPLSYKKTDARKFPADPALRVKKNMDDGKGFKLFDSERKVGTTYEFASSNELWRATLDIIDFMPLTTANYSGGIIVTDWYSDNQNLNENIKITVRFLTNEVRSDGIRIIVHKKLCNIQQNCSVKKISSTLEQELQIAILKKAVLLEKEYSKGKKKFKRNKIK